MWSHGLGWVPRASYTSPYHCPVPWVHERTNTLVPRLEQSAVEHACVSHWPLAGLMIQAMHAASDAHCARQPDAELAATLLWVVPVVPLGKDQKVCVHLSQYNQESRVAEVS